MATYQTPGVYVEEISTLPPSVAGVSTAVPAFIGYTERGSGTALAPKVVRINTLLDYETSFGRAEPSPFTVTVTVANSDTTLAVSLDSPPKFLLYYSLSLYFKNGGGSCYVVSVGNYDSLPVNADFYNVFSELEKEDEPTLILLTDAVHLAAEAYYARCQEALTQCNKLGDRFAILDVLDGDVGVFRDRIGTNDLKYGAAYHPYLQTSLNIPIQ